MTHWRLAVLVLVFSAFAGFNSELIATQNGEVEESAATEIDLSAHFEGFDGCFAMLNQSTGEWTRYNSKRCREQLSPCSTFKIPNAIIALDAGVVNGAEHLLTWDGIKRSRESLNKDHTLRTAMKDSVVWYFQTLARKIGEEKMQQQLDAFDYGNRDISGGIDQFWLGSSLLISADQQVRFLSRLASRQLDVKPETIDVVREILLQPETAHGRLMGKTGTLGKGDKATVGWFVGWVERSDGACIFALNIKADDKANGPKARAIAMNILDAMFPDDVPPRP